MPLGGSVGTYKRLHRVMHKISPISWRTELNRLYHKALRVVVHKLKDHTCGTFSGVPSDVFYSTKINV